MSESHGTAASGYPAVTDRPAPSSRPYGVGGAAPNLKAVPSTPTLDATINELHGQGQRLQEAVGRAREFADKLLGAEPEAKANDYPPDFDGYVGSLDAKVRRLGMLLNELAHHHGRIERALVG